MVEHFWLQGIWNWLGFPFILVSLAFINMFYDVLWMLLSKKTIEFKCFCLVFVHKIIETPHPHASECHQYLVSTFGQSTRGVDESGNH